MIKMTRWGDRQYHRSKHHMHALKYWWHVVLGGLFILVVLIFCCEGVFT